MASDQECSQQRILFLGRATELDLSLVIAKQQRLSFVEETWNIRHGEGDLSGLVYKHYTLGISY